MEAATPASPRREPRTSYVAGKKKNSLRGEARSSVSSWAASHG